jgi:hypothetical protein
MKKTIIGISNAVACMTAFLLLTSCTGNAKRIRNKKEGQLTATCQLLASGEKKIRLDDETAPKPAYMQLYEEASGARTLTLLNTRLNAVYFYDYESGACTGRTRFDREGPNAILGLAGYYVKNRDSIYAYNRPVTEIALTDSAGHVKQRISLRGSFANAENKRDSQWAYRYPQYLFRTVAPFIETDGKLLLTGFFPFSIPDSIIDNFRFMAVLDMKTGQVEYRYLYPKELYGSNANWDDPVFMQGFPELSPGGEIIFSFPVAHHLYIAGSDDTEAYRQVYAGSNVAGTVHSIDHPVKGTPQEVIHTHYLREDLYAAIRYDPWRKVYYRFMLQGIRSAAQDTSPEAKPVIVIVMDEQFNYLGETVIGTGKQWNWTNSFVTREGLNIEYIDEEDEDYLTFKIFKPEERGERL